MNLKEVKLKGIKVDKAFFKDVIKGSLFSLIITLVAVLIFGIVIKLTSISNEIIMPINQVIKVLSIFFGIIFSFKTKQFGAIKGLLVGLIYTLLSLFIFLIIGGTLKGSFNYLDFIFGAILGTISGIVSVNTGKRI